MKQIKTTERGWAGHFFCAGRCNFRRNTLVECGDKKVVVSTVGAMMNWIGDPRKGGGIKGFDSIGAGDRMYETMAFRASFQDGYWDADVSQEFSFESNWSLAGPIGQMHDQKANDMHEAAVKAVAKALRTEAQP